MREVDILRQANLDAFTPSRPHPDSRIRELRSKLIAQQAVRETIHDVLVGLALFAIVVCVLLGIHAWPEVMTAVGAPR